MKYNEKQLAYSASKIRKSKLELTFRMFAFCFLMFFAVSAVFAFDNPSDSAMLVTMGSSTMALFMANIGSIDQPSGRDTGGNQIGIRLWLIAREQIDDTVPFPLPNAGRQIGTIPLKAGEYMHYFDGVENSLKYTGTGEKGDISPTFGKTIPIIIKYSDAALNFVEEYTGKGFILIWQICETADKEMVGTFCKPITLQKFEAKNDGDGKYVMLEFGNTHWRQPLKFTGTISVEAATAVGAAVTELAVGANANYQLADGTGALATVSGITAADYGRFVTILAPAIVTAARTIPDGAAFVMRDGATWTAAVGNSIVFQILDDATLVEVSRIEV